ncbi:GNAT family N-acetyltransferase (plasmid) [Pseudoalteromonas xiamenensis]|uniref:GNAT family N-acetyltransferase n=1 Tax=Pseudoalteromonas xiamenensis TaxID=882626 RepID=UPI0027E3F422|nr:GNAT family protein [Pseudoalteromonas xiamenensis]WMN61893.1 GNAT family N-acetyltransferase [Pseudoalteromonas xiamenensis]
MFYTTRTLIRRLKQDDVDAIYAHRRSHQTSKYIGPPSTQQDAVERVNQAMKPWTQAEGERLMLGIEHRVSGELIGELMFKYTNKPAGIGEIGYRLAEEYLGQGYGLEVSNGLINYVFDELTAHKIQAIAAVDNVASWKLMEKLGMVREGVLREYMLLPSGYSDAVVYGLLKREWLALNKNKPVPTFQQVC